MLSGARQNSLQSRQDRRRSVRPQKRETIVAAQMGGLDKNLIPPKILEAVKISKPFEMLTIRLRNKAPKARKSKKGE
jgi:hypothetical protein